MNALETELVCDLLDLAVDLGEAAAVRWIRARGGFVLGRYVDTFDGRLSIEEALAYAAVLSELGQRAAALDLAAAALGRSQRWIDVPQGAQ